MTFSIMTFTRTIKNLIENRQSTVATQVARLSTYERFSRPSRKSSLRSTHSLKTQKRLSKDRRPIDDKATLRTCHKVPELYFSNRKALELCLKMKTVSFSLSVQNQIIVFEKFSFRLFNDNGRIKRNAIIKKAYYRHIAHLFYTELSIYLF